MAVCTILADKNYVKSMRWAVMTAADSHNAGPAQPPMRKYDPCPSREKITTEARPVHSGIQSNKIG